MKAVWFIRNSHKSHDHCQFVNMAKVGFFSAVLFSLLFTDIVECNWSEGLLGTRHVLRFDQSVLSEVHTEGIAENLSRKKRDVSESSVCKEQEQNFLQEVATDSSFINKVCVVLTVVDPQILAFLQVFVFRSRSRHGQCRCW